MNALLAQSILAPAILAQSTLPVPTVSWAGLSPLLVVAGAAVLMLTLASVTRGKLPESVWPVLTTSTGFVALATVIWQWNAVGDTGPYQTLNVPFGGLVEFGAVNVDRFSLFLIGVICVVIILVPMLAADFVERQKMSVLEFYVLILLSAAGGIVMCGANDLIVMFLGIEILSLAVYVLSAMELSRFQSQEAGMKYFLLGAFASAFLLYGIALIYGATGTTNLTVGSIVSGELIETGRSTGLLLAGFALMLVGFQYMLVQ